MKTSSSDNKVSFALGKGRKKGKREREKIILTYTPHLYKKLTQNGS